MNIMSVLYTHAGQGLDWNYIILWG